MREKSPFYASILQGLPERIKLRAATLQILLRFDDSLLEDLRTFVELRQTLFVARNLCQELALRLDGTRIALVR